MSSAFVFFRFPCSPDSVTVPAHSPAGPSSALRSSSPDSSCASSNSGISLILKRGIRCSPRIVTFCGAGRARCHRPALEVSLWSFCESLAFLCSLGTPTRITHTSLTAQLGLCAEKKSSPLPPPGRYRHRHPTGNAVPGVFTSLPTVVR